MTSHPGETSRAYQMLKDNCGTLPGWTSVTILAVTGWLIINLVTDIKDEVRRSTIELQAIAKQAAVNTALIRLHIDPANVQHFPLQESRH